MRFRGFQGRFRGASEIFRRSQGRYRGFCGFQGFQSVLGDFRGVSAGIRIVLGGF